MMQKTADDYRAERNGYSEECGKLRVKLFAECEKNEKMEKALAMACAQIADGVSKTGYSPMWLSTLQADEYMDFYKRAAGIGVPEK